MLASRTICQVAAHVRRRGPGPPRRIDGSEREQLAEDLAGRYRRGESLRDLAAQIDASYGFVRQLLLDHGVELRTRGGHVRLRSHPPTS